MKIVKIVVSFLLILSLPLMISMVASEVPVVAEAAPGENAAVTNGISADQELRGVWVATVSNINYPKARTDDPEILQSEAITILDNVKNYGMNAVFLQVRPTADAFYKSKYFPWSKYLTGTQGIAPQNDFDPLSYWISEAHKRGIELHAWINPYRVTKRESGEPAPDPSNLSLNSPARTNPSWIIKHEGNYYFNPGIPEVRKLVIDGAMEIVENYDIDGIHFDDYFYPGSDFNDDNTFSTYGRGFTSKGDWRRDNVNILINDLSKSIKAAGRNVAFGISPFGIWANKSRNSFGSDTKGSESYYEHYADTLKWVKDGSIDYIAPQLYWNIGYAIADYSKLLTWWSNAVSGTNVKLYIGQAAYRTGNSNVSSAWYGIDEITRQLRLNSTMQTVKGSIYYNYNSLSDNPALSSAIKAYYDQKDGAVVKTPVSITRPSGNTQTSYSKYYVSGASDPAKPLFINGKLVEARSPLGYYGVLVPLVKGENTITVSQEGSYATRVIYMGTASSSSSSGTKNTAIEIPVSSTFPQSQEYRTAGEKITLSCKAPAGSKVTVKLGNKTYTMKTSTKSGTATYTYTYTIPKYIGTPRNIDLGAPVYTMTYKGKVKSTKAPAKVGVIMKNSPFYALVEKEAIDTYNSTSTGNGCAYELYKGMKDYITGMTGSVARLSSGQWVKKSNITTVNSSLRLMPSVSKAEYIKGNVWDKLVFDITSPSAAFASFNGSTMKLTISPLSKTLLPALPDDSLFSSVKVTKGDNIAYYTLTKKEGQRIEGYYVEKTGTGIILYVKRHITATYGTQALSGIKIMIDPGHGGSESGAIGPLGKLYAEKDINLKSAHKLRDELQRLGAEVLMTRSDDTTMSLADRLAASRNAKPDMFISIHANSTEVNSDISKIFGFSVHHREAIAKGLSEDISSNVISNLARKDRDVHINNFYVVRGAWCPSLLIESGFVPNPYEFEWLTDDSAQTSLAASLAKAIAGYFAN